MQENKEKVFVIINSYRVGDILLTNPMIQNIKRIYKNSKIVMLTSPNLVDVAKYQEGVDDVIIWDRHGENKGFWKTLKFALNFPYKKVYAAIPVYGMDRPVILSQLLGAKHILSISRSFISSFLRKSKYKIKYVPDNVAESHISLLSGITKEELKTVPMIYYAQNCAADFIPKQKYVVICPTSSRKEKDMPYETLVEVIKSIGLTTILVGNGKEANIISENIKKENLENLVDLTGKTNISQVADIMSKAEAIVSVDTGTLHLACALNKPIIALFYNKADNFIPDSKIYNCKLVQDKTPENIVQTVQSLIKEEMS